MKGKEKPLHITINESSASDWKKDLSEYSHSLFLSCEWIVSLESEQYEPVFIDFLEGANVVAKLSAIVNKRNALKGRQLYCFAAPALRQPDVETLNRCLDALKHYAIQKRYTRIIFSSYDQQHQLRCNVKGYYTTQRSEYIVRFNDANEIHFSKGFKKNAGKAVKSGASFNTSTKQEHLNELFRLIDSTQTYRKKKYGSDYDPYYLRGLTDDSLKKIMANGLGVIYYTETEDKKVHCAQLNLEHNGQAYGLLMGSDPEAYQNGHPSFIDLNVIKNLKEANYQYYNPGGNTSDNGGAGLEKYKASMGAEKLEFYGATTNFLVYPQKLLNPLLKAGRRLPSTEEGFIGLLKKLI